MSAQPKLEEEHEAAPLQEAPSQQGYQVASRGKRIFAAIIDVIIGGSINGGLLYLFTEMALPFGAIISGLIVMGGYYIFPTFAFGQTLGKKLLGIMVVPNNPEQDEHNFFFILLRESVFKYISVIPIGLGYLWFFFNEDHKTWHDMLGGTIVVDAE